MGPYAQSVPVQVKPMHPLTPRRPIIIIILILLLPLTLSIPIQPTPSIIPDRFVPSFGGDFGGGGGTFAGAAVED